MVDKERNPKYSRLLTNDWVITLTATLVGVFVAMYLNEWMALRKLNAQKSIATENILTEFQSNKSILSVTLTSHEELLEIMEFLGKYVDDDENLIAPVEDFNKFTLKYPKVVSVEDSTYVDKGVYQYDGEVNLDISFPHFEITTITWNTLKNSGIITSYSYECLLHLETIDNITNEVRKKNKELIDYFTGLKDSGEENRNLISHMKLLIEYEESLLEYYESVEEKLESCS